MKQRRKTILLLMASLLSATMSATDTSLQVLLSNGKTETFRLSGKPQIKFGETDLNITTNGNSVSFNRADIDRIYFSEMIASAAGAWTDNATRLTFNGTELSAQGETIYLYDIKGTLIEQAEDCISTTALGRGVYIAKTTGQTLKIAIF